MMSKQYIAGFIDGEGYLGIVKRKRSDGTFYRLNIKVAQSLKEKDAVYVFFNELKDCYGGYISKTRNPINKNQNPSVMWEIVHQKRIKKFLDDIQPYLILKKEQAKILQKYISIPNLTNANNQVNRDIKNQREELYLAIRKLNKRGLAETERERP